MAEDTSKIKPDAVDAALGDMKLEEDHSSSDTLGANGNRETESPPVEAMVSPSPNPKDSTARSLDELAPTSEDERKQLRGSEITQKVEQPKLSRKSSQKVFLHPPILYDNLPDSTSEAITKFQVIRDCIYGSKYMGSSEHDALGCDCSEEWSEYQSPQ
jgi:[histone H3]-lysine36 N-trimethyltransferase